MPAPDWLPTPGDLADLLSGQTIGAREDATSNSGNFGRVTGAFPADKTATATRAILLAYKKPHRLIGSTTDEELIGPAVDVTLAQAAADFVSIVYSDQATNGQRSRAEEYWTNRAKVLLADLEAAVAAVVSEDEPGPDDDVSIGAVVSFFPASRTRDCYGRDLIV